jgi:tellurium resistance protein TerD
MINLQKGQGINLSKDHGVNRAIIEVTWDPNPDKTSDRKHQFEVNTVAFELTRKDGGKPFAPQDGCFIFYNNLSAPDGGVVHSPDDWQDGDDQMRVDFGALDKSSLGIDEVSCIVEIYEGLIRNQHFGMIGHCTAKIVDADTKNPVAQFKLTDEDSNSTAVQMGSFVKENGHWHFKAVGKGYQKGLADFLHVYGLQESAPE